jgi:hypothetical protein
MNLDQLDYGNLLTEVDALRNRARRANLHEVSRRSGVPVQSIHKWVSGATSSEDLVVSVAMALDEIASESVQTCALDGCDRSLPSAHAKWCTPAHRAEGSRVARGLTDLGRPRTSWATEAALERAWEEDRAQ